MEKVKLDASNFASVVCKANVGKSLEFEDGFKFKLTAYFPSQKDRNGQPCKGRQTCIDYKVGNKEYTDISTEDLKREHCPQREQKPHASKHKSFIPCANLESASDKDLLLERERITNELKRREDERKRAEDAERAEYERLKAKFGNK